MAQEMKKLTFGVAKSMAHHRDQLERKCQEIGRMLSGRTQPLLPEGWTDGDAWELAGTLAELMAQVKRIRQTVFDESNPYPSHDTPLEGVPYYNPYHCPDESPSTPPDIPIELWTEVLHCGILIAAGRLEFCFPSEGTFADLEELFLGVVRYGGGLMQNFIRLIDWLAPELSGKRFRALKEQSFSPEPPQFDAPKDPWEETLQGAVYREWQEQVWLSRFPCFDALLQAVQHLDAADIHSSAVYFVNYEIGMEDLLRQAIDLYLYRTGAPGMAMLDDCYYVAYALLCRTQQRMEASMEAEGDRP